LEAWLYWRDHGMQFGLMPGATEHPDRTLYRVWLDHLISRLEATYRPSEVAATAAPEGRGDELGPAASCRNAAMETPQPASDPFERIYRPRSSAGVGAVLLIVGGCLAFVVML